MDSAIKKTEDVQGSRKLELDMHVPRAGSDYTYRITADIQWGEAGSGSSRYASCRTNRNIP